MTEMHNMNKGSGSTTSSLNIPLYGSQRQKTVSFEIPLKADCDDYESWFHQYDDTVDQIHEWCSAQENLDVYQMNSFYSGIGNVRSQAINYYKTAMVLFIQTGGAGYLAYNGFSKNFKTGSSFCKIDDIGPLSWMAMAFTGFISLTLQDQLTEISVQGVYRFKKNLPPFFNAFWLSLGIFINIFVLINSWVVSMLVIFISTNPMDMILNSVAVYFIIELDDMMVNRVDYEFVDVWLKDELDMWMRAKYEKRRKVGYEIGCTDRVGKCILGCASVTEISCVKWIIRIFAVITPIFVFLCFDQNFEGVGHL
eukprot:296352_1